MLKNMKKELVKAIVLSGAAGIVYCSLDGLDGGGGSDAGNGIIRGIIVRDDGTPASRTTVILIPSSYNPIKASGDALSTDTTSDDGGYEFRAPRKRTYNILAHYEINRMRSIIRNITLDRDTVSVFPDTLRWPGTVAVNTGGIEPAEAGCLYIPGTTIAAAFNGAAAYATLDSVPAGLIPAIYYQLKKKSADVLRYNVRVPPGTIIAIEKAAWKYAMPLFLNTTSSGAQVYQTVVYFPVLVRLTADNFNFDEAKPDGGDIRFTKSDNTRLPYEIERWDHENKKAEIWVKADTILGNNCTQYLMMYWGNAAAPNNSDGEAVFDTAHDYVAIWHLNDNCIDATANKHHGTDYGTDGESGMIGGCKRFDGNDYIKMKGLLGSPSTISVSAWAHTDAASLPGQEVISLGNAVLIRADDYLSKNGTTGAFRIKSGTCPKGSEYCAIRTGRFLKNTGWHLISYVIDPVNKYQAFYIDGALCGSTFCSKPIHYDGAEEHTFFGIHASLNCLNNFKGKLDEVRICRTIRGPQWMWLCYMNQKNKDALVTMNYRDCDYSIFRINTDGALKKEPFRVRERNDS